METKSTEIQLDQERNIEESSAKDSKLSEGFVSDLEKLDACAISALNSIFELIPEEPVRTSMTASVKFMITIQEEKDLRNLGYSQEQIDKMKPQEALDILHADTK